MLWLTVLLGCPTPENSAAEDSAADAIVCVDDDGVEHAVGESWTADDCGNTCSCDDVGDIICTDLGCP